MGCPSCKADLPKGTRFCDECGAPVQARCPSCRVENRPSAKFCSECGARLSEPTASVLDGAAAAPISVGERRQLTVMFVDLVGSTSLSTQLDPEDLREVLGAYQNCVAETVGRFDGFVAKYMGDGVLVYFGYPSAHEDDAERAVRAGLELVSAVRRVSSPTELQSRIGIATGLVVVGDLIGAGAAQERGVIGETPNLAARLQVLAAPDEVIIAPSTRRLTGRLFEYEQLTAVTAKGFAEPVSAWRVRGESSLPSRFEALRSGDAPLIGREEEIDLLLRRWQRGSRGEGQVVAVSGEPGIGKSRLVAALQERIAHEAHTPLRYYCSPRHQDSALFPIVSALEHSAGFARDDPPATKFEKLEALLSQAMLPGEDVVVIADLLSLTSAGDLAPRRKKERTFEALLRHLERSANRNPVLMIFEDLHWSDPTSREWLDRVAELAPALPILLVATFRPEFQPPWSGQAHASMLTLNRLDRREGTTLAEQIAGETELPSEVLAEIVERSDGVPLFVEELTKAVLGTNANGTDRDPMASLLPSSPRGVPATLHASLMARLDRLGPRAKEAAQIGAAVGREFSYELLADVWPLPEATLREALEQLVASGLVLHRGSPPEASYTYKHALIQDAAYSTLLRSRRREWHARIAVALEQRLPVTATARPELLAHHLTEAGRARQAVDFWAAAGAHALRRAAHREASAFFLRALAALTSVEEAPETLAQVVDLRRQLHQALYPLGQLESACANLTEAERAAERLGDSVRLSRVLSSQVYVRSAIGDLKGAVSAGERALSLLAACDDLDAAVNTRLMLARTLYAAGRYDEARTRAQEAAGLLGDDVERGALGGLNQTVSARVWLTLCYAEQGEFELGAAESEAASQLAAHPRCSEHEVLWSRIGLGRLRVIRGDLGGVIEALATTLPLCEGELSIYFSRVAASLGTAYAGTGRIDEGVALLERADAHAQAIGFAFGHALTLAQLAGALLLARDLEHGHEVALRALDAARRWGERGNEAWSLCVLGDIASAITHRPEAEVSYREALAIAKELRMAPVQARCLDGLFRLRFVHSCLAERV